MYCGSNKTAISSQRQIADALMELMSEKPYEQITISELCKSAGISRQTFYTLFTSRENVVVYTLQEKYCYSPNEEALVRPPKGACEVRMLCRGYSEYIRKNRDFLRTLVNNHIDYLLYDSIYEALADCGCFLSKADPRKRKYAAGFYAGGISSVARCYVADECAASGAELEEMLYTLFTGALF
ncbi:MAG: TetR family transcriptional regulator [Clostridia bacterium]|nr:TetR family transcriptional regulator [Clostridia bacterium]